MNLFQKKKKKTYDPEKLKPVILASICFGEKTAGFKNLETGRFESVMLVKSEKDILSFCEEYGIKREDIETVY